MAFLFGKDLRCSRRVAKCALLLYNMEQIIHDIVL